MGCCAAASVHDGLPALSKAKFDVIQPAEHMQTSARCSLNGMLSEIGIVLERINENPYMSPQSLRLQLKSPMLSATVQVSDTTSLPLK